MDRSTSARARFTRIAGTLLVLAGIAVVMGIITAEALYPSGYTTGDSQISDLGGTEPPHSIVVQPSATIFDATMAAAGILILAGGGALFTGQVFALLTFISGGVAAILFSGALRGPMRYISLALGLVPLTNLILYIVLQNAWFVTGLGLGGLARWVAYPIVLWLIAIGRYVLGAELRDERTVEV